MRSLEFVHGRAIWLRISVPNGVAVCEHRHCLIHRGRTVSVTTRLRVLDDGAWLSINDTREVRVSELWRLESSDFCDCDLVDLVVENFQTIGVDGSTVETRVHGQCIACGAAGTTGWLPVGRIRDGEFAEFDRSSVRRSRTGIHRR